MSQTLLFENTSTTPTLYQSHFTSPPPPLWGKISKARTMRGMVLPSHGMCGRVVNHEGGHGFHRGGMLH